MVYMSHNHRRKFATVCGVSIVVLLSLTLIKSCHLLCCSQGATSSPIHNLRNLGEGFQISLTNTVREERSRYKQPAWWQIWTAPKPKKDTLEDSLALRAIKTLQESLHHEKQAQDTVRAVLKRREIKHKKLLKGLQEGGWHLNVNEQASQGVLQAACGLLKQYLHSPDYHEARRQRLKSAKGQGIAIAAGGPLNLANTYVTLHMLRKVHGSSLPVEIFFNGEDEFDLKTQQLFEEDFSGVRCVDVSLHALPLHMAAIQKSKDLSKQQDGWMTKSQMLYLSSFQEVLVLDSDNVPLKDPAFLFDTKEYKSGGNLFWPDFWTNNFHNPGPAYSLLGMANPWLADTEISTTESGQFLIDRRQHDDVLEWVTLLNLHGNMIYDLIWGDKDTYRLAFHLAEKAEAFSQIIHKPANALHDPDRPLRPAKLLLRIFAKSTGGAVTLIKDLIDQQEELPKFYTHAGMIQMSPDGNMLFLHRTSDAKLDPDLDYPFQYEPLQQITAPLSARQAAQVHISGGMKLEKFTIDNAKECGHANGLDLTQLARGCNMLDSGSRDSMPGDVSKLFPVPIFSIEEFPELQFQLEEGMHAFRHLQHLYLARQVRLGSPERIAPEEIPEIA